VKEKVSANGEPQKLEAQILTSAPFIFTDRPTDHNRNRDVGGKSDR